MGLFSFKIGFDLIVFNTKSCFISNEKRHNRRFEIIWQGNQGLHTDRTGTGKRYTHVSQVLSGNVREAGTQALAKSGRQYMSQGKHILCQLFLCAIRKGLVVEADVPLQNMQSKVKDPLRSYKTPAHRTPCQCEDNVRIKRRA